MKIGVMQKLEILRDTPHGVFLNAKEEPHEKDILLPKRYVTDEMEVGQEIEVFIYLDSEDRVIATTKRPAMILGEVAWLEVKDVNKHGAYLDWGLEKDLFLPFKEQTVPVKKGMKVLVTPYFDKSRRLSASMNLYRFLPLCPHPTLGDWVQCTVYDIKEMGVFVAVQDLYSGFIPAVAVQKRHHYGEQLTCRISRIHPDGKIDLSERATAGQQVDSDCQAIMKLLDENGGMVFLSDNSDPEVIKEQLGISKKAFKRAIGKLYKEQRIVLTDVSIVKKS